MLIKVNIPDAIAAAIDAEAKQMIGPEELQQDGSISRKPLFPGGIHDWVRAAIQQNIQDMALRSPDKFPAIKAIQNEQKRKQKEWKDALSATLNPTVT